MPQNSIPAAQAVKAQQLRFGAPRPPATEVQVAVEAPINIVYGNMPYAVMMATPQDLEDFVAGFSLTEGIVQSVDEIRGMLVATQSGGVLPSASTRISLGPAIMSMPTCPNTRRLALAT